MPAKKIPPKPKGSDYRTAVDLTDVPRMASNKTNPKKLRLTDTEMKWIFETSSYLGLNNSRQFPESELVRGIIRGIIESKIDLTHCRDEFQIADQVKWAINGQNTEKKNKAR